MKLILAIALFYSLFSIFEWLFHRHIMHDCGDAVFGPAVRGMPALGGVRERHGRHHLWVDTAAPLAANYHGGNDRRPADPRDRWLERYEGLYFLWPATLGVFVPLVTIYVGLNAVFFRLPPVLVVAIAVAFVTYQSAMWNCMHPALHGKADRKLQWHEGIDFIDIRWIRDSKPYRWLWQNHVLHHLRAGTQQGNFNVTAPLADLLFGTYNRQARNFAIDRATLTVTPLTRK